MMDSFLTNTMLFRGTNAEEAKAMLQCLGGYKKHYRKGDAILRAGECVSSMGLILSGRIITIPNSAARTARAVISHLHVDLNTLSAIIPPTGARSSKR